MAWIQDQPAAGRFQAILERASSGGVELWISAINVGEVYYLIAKRLSPDSAEGFLKQFPSLPVKSVVPSETDIIEAARLKVRYRISYADSFAASLAIQQGVQLITGDPDFKRLLPSLELEWIG
jgi:predicted nucleic acid-binding protein